ncbi:PAS domain-containing hybrid sensor histidine kinase/response regulator [Oligoflexus tunisiensis]|uniref:PAS domain-containing hybrid sensor histidine kinase/response regulator n=1 Tax=Oligoflexus tunisiensis TaxID=708132 RepID=UPI00114CBCC4|nr:PAS domain S-box protein [Oligoflexus tunisiensis]
MIDSRDTVLDQMFDSSPVGMSLTFGPNHTYVKVNKKYYECTGLMRSVIGMTVRDALPELVEQGYIHLLDRVYQTGEAYTGTESPVIFQQENGRVQQKYFDFSLQALFNESGRVFGILIHGFDVTDKVLSRQALERSKRMIENERESFRNLFKHTPEEVCILRGPNHIFEFVNDAHIKALGFDATGMSAREAHPQATEMVELLDEIYRTGKVAKYHEHPVMLNDRLRYFNITYSASRDENGAIDGIMALGTEVTDQVLWRQALEMSEARFKQLADSMPQIVYVSNPDGSVTFLNERWREYTGTYEEVMYTRISVDIIHPDDWISVIKGWEKATHEKSRFDVEVRLRSSRGEYRWFVTRAVPHIVNDEIIEWFGTSTDIHDQKLAAEELARSRERYRIVFENSPVPMWIMDPDSGQFLDVNNMALKTYGYERDEFLRMKATDLLPPEDRETFWKTMQEATLTQDRFLQSQARHVPKNAPIIHVEVTMRDLMLDGHWQRIATMVNVSRRVAIEEQLRQLMQKLQAAKEEAERANQLKSAFLANMSHEIRTPLGAMLGFADLLRDPNLTQEEHSNYLNILVRNGEQLTIIINDILDLSKVEAGHLTLEFIEVDPASIVRDVFSLLDIKAREKNLELSYNADPSTPAQLTTDPVRLRQVLLNLLSNAIKFTPQGYIHIRSYGERNEQGRVQLAFEIRDSGIGVAPEQHERIFEMFVQADESTTRKFGGTGLGLPLSRKLARALGGDVRVLRSGLNEGSTFLFTITDLPELKDQQDKQPARPSSTPAPTTDSVSLEGLSILVVDDAPDIRSLIAFLLKRAGAMVDFAEDGMEGYRKALSKCYDIILMDIQMPLMDGYTATMKLREQGYRKPIIALTAHAMTESRKKCLSVGCTGHLPKPINPSNLLGVVAFHARH